MANEMLWSTQSGYLTNNTLNMDFQKQAQPLMKFRQFVSTKEAFGKHKGQTVNWLKVANVGTYGGTLTETNTMHETTQALSWGTLTVNEYGNSIPFSFAVDALSEFDIREIVKGGLMDDCAKCIDGDVERQFNSTLLRYAGTSTAGYALTTNGTATASNTSVLNTYHWVNMVGELKKRNVPGYGSLNGDYAAILSVEAAQSVINAMTAVNQYTEKGYTKILNGECGTYYGVRAVEDRFASRNVYSSSARTVTAKSWTQAQSLDAYFFGSPTVREAIVVPEEVRLKVVTDYGRSHGIAWYFLGGWKLEWDTTGGADSRIVKWDSAG